ncbi:hypothetical protein Patl1_29872 [Pistacia atlantica]|uniref:Uncharacterized protein n=1 Tax=Pistacia atlantica TaxID=434234 RepID=A0ACC1ACW5_9ROSI|nr:hypothetical protein Patl1_29872 [Pistacia atlantica]
MPQQNGHWGAQIYANHQIIWLGTFKSEKEAAMAYDSAAIKIRGNDSHRNFPLTDSNNQEPNFQNQFTVEAILNMIRDGTYHPESASFLRIQSQREHQNYSGGGTASLNQIMVHGDEQFSCRQLFQKELKEKDIITFYLCKCTNNSGKEEGQNFFLLDVIQNTEIGIETQLQLERNNNIEKKKKVLNSDVHQNKGFRLFGVQIRR